MLTVSVAAVVAGLGVPALMNVSLDGHRTTVVNELVTTLMLARSEAIKLGRPVVVCGVRDGNRNGALDPPELSCAGRDWSEGWLLGAWNDTNGDGFVTADELTVLRTRVAASPGRLTVKTGNFMATPPVRPAGTVVLKPFSRRSSNGTITVCDRRGSRAARAIIISPNGRPRISSTASDGQSLVCP
jgi:type IV fimbrial biogenesis protein FimT